MHTRTRPTLCRSCEGRACPGEGWGTSPHAKGESRGGHPPLARGLGDVPPVMTKTSEGGGWAQPTSQCRPKSLPWQLPCALFPFVDYGPFSTETHDPRSARALADTTYSPFSTVSTPPSGALGPSSDPCLADTTCLPLSTCPSRLNPKLRRPLPGTGCPEKTLSTIQSKSNRRSTRASEGSVIELPRGNAGALRKPRARPLLGRLAAGSAALPYAAGERGGGWPRPLVL